MNFNRNQSNQNGGHHHVIGITPNFSTRDYFSSMEEKIDRSNPKLLSKTAGKESCCIFRVPQSLVEINQKAYKPHILSIGPYHYGKPDLAMIQEHKLRYLGSLISQTRQHGVTYGSLFSAIAAKEQQIRESYSETIELDSKELIEIMILDGCFIIKLFFNAGNPVLGDHNDPIFHMAWIFPFLTRDLLRLENQIPYFVIQTLFDLTISNLAGQGTTGTGATSLPELTLKFFNHMVQRKSNVLEEHYNLQGKHLLDLFRSSFIPPASEETTQMTEDDNSPFLNLIPSAKKLHLAGIKFRLRKTDSFLDLQFQDGVLHIPKLTIDDFISSVFLNFVAFEQCYPHCSKHMTTYAILMGCLINTPSDAGFLSDHKIIENYFGTDDEVTRFFNNMGKDVAFDIQKSYLSGLFKGVNEYHRNTWYVQWAQFKHTYFGTPWSFMSAFAAMALLLLTMVQAFFAVYGYFKPLK